MKTSLKWCRSHHFLEIFLYYTDFSVTHNKLWKFMSKCQDRNNHAPHMLCLSFYSICNTLFSYFRLLLTASIFPCLSWSNTTSLLPFHFVSSRAEHFVISNSHLKIHMVDFIFCHLTVVPNDIDVWSSEVTFLPANNHHFHEQHADRNFPARHRFSF